MTALSTIYEDDHVVVVAKPSGVLVHNSAWAGPPERTLLDDVRAIVPTPHLVHRLDRGTSGLVVVARTPGDARLWQEALADEASAKTYLALTRGRMKAPALVEHPITDEEGVARPARSSVTPLLRDAPPRCSLVAVRLFTGRRHQARRHLKHLSHPVLGDATYGKGPLNRAFRDAHGLSRLALHAWRLDVVHPSTGAVLSLSAPLPDDLRAPLQRIFGAEALDEALRAAAATTTSASSPTSGPPTTAPGRGSA